MASRFLWVDVLESRDAERRLEKLEHEKNAAAVKQFLQDEGWRLLRDTGLYTQRIPLWKILEAYEFTFEQNEILYDLIREFTIYKQDGTQLDNREKETFILEIKTFGNAGCNNNFSDTQKSVIKYAFQKVMALLLKSEVLKFEAVQTLNNAGLVQKKAVHGLPMPQLVQPHWTPLPPETFVPSMPGEKEDVATTEKESALVVPSHKEALTLAGGWYAVSPQNKALNVGLLLLQDVKHREIYRRVWGGAPDTAKAFGRSVQNQRDRFINFAKRKGYDMEALVKRQ